MASRIENYGLIGDCNSAALVGNDGSIDWLCWPRFDSDACFAALLGTPEHGRWRIAPRDIIRTRRRYRPQSLILETTFDCAKGRAILTDFMIRSGSASHVVRIISCESGNIEIDCHFVLRFGYGTTVPWVNRLDDGALRALAGPDMVILRTPAPLRGEGLTTVGSFPLRSDETVPFVLSYGNSYDPPPPALDPRRALQDCETYWHDWVSRCSRAEEFTEPVTQSLLVLKALIYAPTGGIVAAPTSSLPERFGGTRNWDYRFCWLRDATLALLALMNCGYYDEAKQWRDWLQRAIAGNPDDIRIMYGLMGERRLYEWEVPWLSGYEGARPVRMGNAAHAQFQLDIYGELMDAFEHGRRGGLAASDQGWSIQCTMLAHLAKVWQQPDHGIWEVRGPPQNFTFSKVMAWVAFDRGIAGIERHGLSGPLDAWREIRDEIRDEILSRGFNAEKNHFQISFEDPGLDAALLLLAPVGFVDAHDPRFVGTVEAIEHGLVVDGFVHRYDTSQVKDGLPAGEAAFVACTCWLADALIMLGRRDEAENVFERVLAVRNELGLLAEEYDVSARRLAGNFPQAFSHVALINTALNLTRASKPSQQRAAE